MELSLFSVSYAGLWSQHRLGVTDFIAKAAELGYGSVMLMGKRPHLSALDCDDTALESIRGALAPSREVRQPWRATPISRLTPPLKFRLPRCNSPTSARWRRRRGAGAKFVRMFTAYEHPSATGTAAWKLVADSLRECADWAADYQVTLAVQNHHDVALHSDALVELLADVDRQNVKLAFDAWSPALRGEELYETAKRLAPHVAITTNADYVRVPRYRYRPELVNYERLQPDLVRAVPFGEGFIDYPAFFAGLVDGGFDGLVNYEMCSPIRGGGSSENLNQYARRYLQWMGDWAAARSPRR